MIKKNRNLLFFLFGIFIFAFALLTFQIHGSSEKYAISEAEKKVQNLLFTHRAIHQYVNNVSRPELYRLKKEGKLYSEYFSPKTMSFTYTARGIKDYLNKEREEAGQQQIYFKLASKNPRNEINRADKREMDLLDRMNRGDLKNYREVISEPDGSKALYYAIPTKPIVKGCLKCHGNPEDAPEEMQTLYPGAAGYYEQIGDIRALISIRIPLQQHIEEGQQRSIYLIIMTLTILTGIYLLIWLFIRRLDLQQKLITDKNEQLERLSNTDYLTEIYNRMGFLQAAQLSLNNAIRRKNPFSIIMFDLDNFKQVNDGFGHKTGDTVLKEVTRLINKRLRKADVFGRYGGEEFTIAIQEDREAALELAEELRKSIEQNQFYNNIKLSASFGIKQMDDETGLDQLLNDADQALYQAKKSGRNQVILFNF